MKKTFKKALSVVLSLALMLACLTCSFSGVTASAETTLPSRMIKLTGPSWGSDSNPYAAIIKTTAARTGHTYRLSMYRSPNLSVYYNYYVNGTTWTQFSTSFSVLNGLSTCEFTLNNTNGAQALEIRFNIGGTGKSFYLSDVKLVDVTEGSDTNLLNDPTVSGNFANWGRGMLNSTQLTATAYPEKMFRIAGEAENKCVLFTGGALTNGHTYKIKMLQSGVKAVRVIGTNWSTYKNYVPAVSTEGEYTTYTFTFDLTGSATNSKVLFYPGASGTEAYMADISITDTTSSTVIKTVPTDGTQTWAAGYLNDAYWVGLDVNGRVTILDFNTASVGINPTVYDATATNMGTFGTLVDFDADVMGALVPPAANTDYPEKELKLTAPNYGSDANAFAIIYRKSGLTAGHTYRLAMFQKGLLGVKYNLYASGTTWTQYSMEAASNGAYYIYQFVPTQSYVEIRFNIGGTGKTSYVADLKLYDITDPTTNLINDIATSENTAGWSKQMLNANQQTSDVDLGTTVVVEDFNKSDFGIIDEQEAPTKMFRIYSSIANGAVAFNVGAVTAGHTYEVSMLQSGVKKVAAMSTNWSSYERKDATVSRRGDYTVYTFIPTYSSYCQIYISGLEADSICFVSNIRVIDTTASSVVKEVGDDEAWKGAMITGNPMLYQNAAGGSAALMDYDAVALGDIESEKPAVDPEKAICITAPVYGGGDDNPAAIMTKASVTAGHTYRLTMYEKRILSVQYNEYTNNVWSAHPISGISDDGFSVYYFIPTQSSVEIRLSIGGSGKTSFVSAIKLYDIEDGIKTNLINDPTESGTFNNWGTHMLTSNQMGTGGYSAEICGPYASIGSTAGLVDYNEKYFVNLGDYNSDGIIDARDFVRLKKYAINGETSVKDNAFVTDGTVISSEFSYARKLLFGYIYADFAEVTNFFRNTPCATMRYAGGADDAADDMKEYIESTGGGMNITGTIYYVSENGNNNAYGTQANPISVDAVNDLSLSSGDAVLFKRGDTFRLSSPIDMVSGVTYAAYGEGEKPEIYGSVKNYAKATWFEKSPNVWQTPLEASDAGVMVFDGGASTGVKQDLEARLTKNGDYLNDTYWNVLFLYCDKGNPAQVYKSIELATTKSAFYGHAVNNVKVDNISVKYTGAHALDFHADYTQNQTRNITVTNCEIGWGGGFWFKNGETDHGEQFGNGIEFYGPARDINVNHCYIYQQFDAGLTFQEQGYVDYRNITFDSNNIEYCAYSIEFFNGGEDGVANHLNEGYYRNIQITNNILRFAGYGFGSNRPHAHGVAHITCWDRTFNKSQSNFTVTGNIFDCSANNLIYWPHASTTATITASGNKFYQRTNPIDYTSLYHVDTAASGYVANASLNIGTQQSVTGSTQSARQSSFTTQMRLFESGTNKAFWLKY